MSKKSKPKWKLAFFNEKELRKWFGPRCDEQQPGCAVCEAWTRHDMINHMRWQDANTRVQLEHDAWQENKK